MELILSQSSLILLLSMPFLVVDSSLRSFLQPQKNSMIKVLMIIFCENTSSLRGTIMRKKTDSLKWILAKKCFWNPFIDCNHALVIMNLTFKGYFSTAKKGLQDSL